MNQKFTAEEVQHLRQRLKSGEYDGTVIMRAWIALEAYADSIERAQAGVTDEVVERAWMAYTGRDQLGTVYARDAECMLPRERKDMRAALLAVWPNPPAQAAQVDSANWFAGKYPTTTEPAQPADSGRADLWVVFDEVASWLPYDGDDNRIRERFSEACAALAAQQAALTAQGQGNPVAWLVVDAKGKRFTIYNRELAEAIRQTAEQIGSTLTVKGVCEIPPQGWYCTRQPGHEGPCAAWENTPPAPQASPAGVPDGTDRAKYSLWGLIHNGVIAADPAQGAKDWHMRSLIGQMVPHLVELAELKGIRSQFDHGIAAAPSTPEGESHE